MFISTLRAALRRRVEELDARAMFKQTVEEPVDQVEHIPPVWSARLLKNLTTNDVYFRDFVDGDQDRFDLGYREGWNDALATVRADLNDRKSE